MDLKPCYWLGYAALVPDARPRQERRSYREIAKRLKVSHIGDGGGIDEGVFRGGGAVSAPSIVFKVDPEYSEQARKANYQGTVVLHLVVQKDGTGH